MLLRNSEYKGKAKRSQVLDLARNARGDDDHGYRSEFIELVEMTKTLGKK